jgi:hypothetical protein
MYKVELVYPNYSIATIEVDAPTPQGAANRAIDENPAAFIAVSDDGAVATALSAHLGF